MIKHHPLEFTCKTCGAHQLTVTRVWHILAGPESESWQEWGPLEANHLWHFEFKEKIKKAEEAEEAEEDKVDRLDYREDFFDYANDNAISKPEDYEIHDLHDNPGNDMFYVNCTGCDREIEFGWSQPDRGGGIFPVECPGFNPKGIWPEPRYLNSWHEKNWLSTEKG